MGGVRKIDSEPGFNSESGFNSEKRHQILAPDPVSLQILDFEYGSVLISAMLLHILYTLNHSYGIQLFPKI